MPIATVHDAIASIHAGIIADYLLARLEGDRATMTDIRSRADRLDARHGGDLGAQLDALRSSQAA
ncbi:hypothetical protein [Streptomyces sp. NPDC127040]|uniref:hypothetical protein n=1 Tax=Streptomyces sp. NPDC127040 TaxID=3347116 RepID=UPI003664D9C4